MKRKLFMATAMLSAACAFGACAPAQTEEPADANTGEDVKPIDTPASNLTDEPVRAAATELTDGKDIGFELHYDGLSYEAIQRFSYRLFNETVNGGTRNPVISPVSAYLALSMAGWGADGNTQAEFEDVLGGEMMALSDAIMNRFPTDSEDLTLSLANSAWIDTQCIVDENWLEMIQSVMDAEAFQSELSGADTMNRMNRWIADKTNGLIEKMIEEPLQADTRLVLFNTLYFHAKWRNPFKSNGTRAEDFFLADGGTVNVDMMHRNGEQFDYISNDFAEGVILPYVSDISNDSANLAFIALKPKKDTDSESSYDTMTDCIENSADVENFGSSGYVWELTGEMISELLDSRQTKTVNLKLPKFEITFDKELNKILQDMGLKECFDPNHADFSRMGKTVSGDSLFISLVRQKAKIIVDEEGTEAAAATEIEMRAAGAMRIEDPIEIYFDEPFLYLIMDMDREVPLFIGIMDNP